MQPVEVEHRRGIPPKAEEYHEGDVAEYIRLEVPVLKLLLLLLSKLLETHALVNRLPRGHDQPREEVAACSAHDRAAPPCRFLIRRDARTSTPGTLLGCPILLPDPPFQWADLVSSLRSVCRRTGCAVRHAGSRTPQRWLNRRQRGPV